MEKAQWDVILDNAALSVIDHIKSDIGDDADTKAMRQKLSEYQSSMQTWTSMDGSASNAIEALISYIDRRIK